MRIWVKIGEEVLYSGREDKELGSRSVCACIADSQMYQQGIRYLEGRWVALCRRKKGSRADERKIYTHSPIKRVS